MCKPGHCVLPPLLLYHKGAHITFPAEREREKKKISAQQSKKQILAHGEAKERGQNIVEPVGLML